MGEEGVDHSQRAQAAGCIQHVLSVPQVNVGAHARHRDAQNPEVTHPAPHLAPWDLANL